MNATSFTTPQESFLPIYSAAKNIPWNELSKGNETIVDPETSLSLIRIQYGDLAHKVIQQVVNVWEDATEKIRNTFHHFEPSYQVSHLARERFNSARYLDDESKKNLHLAVCGTEELGIQGSMFWESRRSTIYLRGIMTSPTNVPSPITDPLLRIKGVGAACIRSLKHFCKLNNFQKISLCSLPESVEFYERCGFQRHDSGDLILMDWTLQRIMNE